MAISILLALAGLMGACGIVLAAAGAHATPGAGLDSAAFMLLFHAVAVLGGSALAQQGMLWRPLALVVFAAWVLGAGLFSGDIALRAFIGHRLFPMAAPSGGIILIAAWIGLAAAAVAALPRAQFARAALSLLDDTIYAGYSGRFGDCGDYHGFVVGFPPIATQGRLYVGADRRIYAFDF